MKEVAFYQGETEGKLRCGICPHRCLLAEGERGICGVRENREGKLVSLNYGKIVAAGSDPIEKKPLFHFFPGSKAFSIAAAGCNMSCDHCQNYRISQLSSENIPGRSLSPEEAVGKAIDSGADIIAHTYTEPTIFYEYARDVAQLARRRGLKNVFVTNGFIEKGPLEEIAPYLDAANVDLKSFSDDFYRDICGARLEPVLKNIRSMKELGLWVELTTLVIPDLNDSREELNQISQFIADLDPAIPWHVSRFRPAFKMKDRSPTPVSKLKQAFRIGKDAGLNFVYQGNVPGEGEDTICPSCGTRLIERFGFQVRENLLEGNRCPQCGEKIAGEWG